VLKEYSNTVESVRFVFKHFSRFVHNDRWFLLFTLVVILFHTVSNTAVIWLLGTPVTLLQQGKLEQLNVTLLLLLAVLLFNQLARLAVHLAFNWLGLRYTGRVRNYLFGSVLNLSFPVMSTLPKGDLLARLSNDIDQTQAFLLEVPLGLVSYFFTLLFYVVMLLWIDLDLTLIALLFAPLLFLQQRYFAPRKGQASSVFFQRNGELLAFEEQALSNLRGVSSFVVEAQVSGLHRNAYEHARKWAMRMRSIDGFHILVFNLLLFTCGAVIVYRGIQDVQQGTLEIGTLISFLLYLGYLSYPVKGFAEAPILWQGQMGAARRVHEVMTMEPNVKEKADSLPLTVSQGEICFDQLSFSYGRETVFKNLSATVHAGETVALVGPSGSGKSTLAVLLMRFFEPNSGCIRIDGVDIGAVTLKSLRDSIAVVWQDPFFINDTVAANLRLARADASEAQMRQACEQSSVWEFVSNLRQGLNTELGVQDLSVGQRQRLCIAQAFLKDAPILIMDEASSALDSQSEQVIVESLQRLREGRTTLIIAHRYSTIRLAHRIMYLNGDGSMFIGSHDELLREHEGYRHALAWQARGGEHGEDSE